MTQLYANPYNLAATGFYFETLQDYQEKVQNCFDDYGYPAEEFEIEFIDGEDIDAALSKAWGLHQGNFHKFLEAVETLAEHEKITLIAMGESGYSIDENTDTGDVDIYHCESLKDLAAQFVEEGLFGEIAETIIHYIDYDAIARDLSMDYSEMSIGGQTIVYRCH